MQFSERDLGYFVECFAVCKDKPEDTSLSVYLDALCSVGETDILKLGGFDIKQQEMKLSVPKVSYL